MSPDLLKLVPASPAFLYTLACFAASTAIFRAAANYAHERKKNKATIENLRFTKLLQEAIPLLCIFVYALFNVIL